MEKNHVPQSPQSVTASAKRLTLLQHFVTIPSSLVRRFAPNNQDTRPPADRSIWPPPIILDLLYGIAAIKRWSTQTTADLIHKWTKADYYKQEILEQQNAHTAERLQRAEEQAKQKQEEIDIFDMLLYLSRLSGPRFVDPCSRVRKMLAEKKSSNGCKVIRCKKETVISPLRSRTKASSVLLVAV